MNYILNLMYLMIDSDLTDLQYEHHQKVMNEIYYRFMPELNDQQIRDVLKKILKDCINPGGAVIIESLHDLMQKFK